MSDHILTHYFVETSSPRSTYTSKYVSLAGFGSPCTAFKLRPLRKEKI